MDIQHKYMLINGNMQMAIIVSYPDEYEFSLDFNSFKKNVHDVSDKIRDYIVKNLGAINNDTAFLILNGVIVGTLFLSGLTNQAKSATINTRDTNSKSI